MHKERLSLDLAIGWTDEQVAEKFWLSLEEVRKHRDHILVICDEGTDEDLNEYLCAVDKIYNPLTK